MNESQIRERIREAAGRSHPGKIRVFSDTSHFMDLSAGDVIHVGGRYYYVHGEETEGRFGLDDQPKFWVKRARDLETGQRKIIKLAFFESFTMNLGDVRVECFRSPKKEARILRKTSDDEAFMTGIAAEDDAGNVVRILDRINGVSIYTYLQGLKVSHEEFFHEEFPRLFAFRFFWALAGIFALYLLVDWFFLPRPVPPALLLYTRQGPGRPYQREEDSPWWLEGDSYWVWRYLLLSPAELNKPWEKDWERVDLWIRADGPEAGQLEWVVTDLHYRELWAPFHKLGDPKDLASQVEDCRRVARDEGAGVWVVEVDADLVFHTPVLRGISFLEDTGGIPVRGIGHIGRSLWKRVRDDDVTAPGMALHRIRLEGGLDLLGDLPELIMRRAERRLLEEPWTYWRYPLGSYRKRDLRLYEPLRTAEPPPAADPSLQIKASRNPSEARPGGPSTFEQNGPTP